MVASKVLDAFFGEEVNGRRYKKYTNVSVVITSDEVSKSWRWKVEASNRGVSISSASDNDGQVAMDVMRAVSEVANIEMKSFMRTAEEADIDKKVLWWYFVRDEGRT